MYVRYNCVFVKKWEISLKVLGEILNELFIYLFIAKHVEKRDLFISIPHLNFSDISILTLSSILFEGMRVGQQKIGQCLSYFCIPRT